MRRSGPPSTRSRYQNPTTLPGLRVQLMCPPSLNGCGHRSAGDTQPADGKFRSKSRLRSALVVFVMSAPPEPRLVAPFGRAVEPLVHAPEAVHSALVRGVGVVNNPILQHERAHTCPSCRYVGQSVPTLAVSRVMK